MTDSTIPVKSHNTRDPLTGLLYQSSEAQRTTETAAEQAARQRAIERKVEYVIPAVDQHERIHALKREADRLAAQGRIGLDWRARFKWIAGQGGFTLREVCLYLGK